jgi:hypothetical protein
MRVEKCTEISEMLQIKKPFRRPKHGLKYNIKIDLKVVGLMTWIYQVEDRDDWLSLVNAVLNLPAPYKAGNFFCR